MKTKKNTEIGKDNGQNQDPKDAINRSMMRRMYYIFTQLQEVKYPNATDIAKHLEVVRSTVYRDIDMMRDSLGVPVQFDSRKNGFYLTEPMDHFPVFGMTEMELKALCLIRNFIELFPGTILRKLMKAMYDKAVSLLDDTQKRLLEMMRESVVFQPLGIEIVDPEVFEVVLTSRWEQRAMKCLYCKPGCEPEERIIQPWAIGEARGGWYVVGYCERAQDERTFCLSRISKPELLEETYTIPQSFNAKKHFSKCFGVQKGKGNYHVVVEMEPVLADINRPRQWHPSQKWEDLDDGRARISFQLTSLVEIKYIILNWGAEATVIEPAELRQELKEECSKMAAKYE